MCERVGDMLTRVRCLNTMGYVYGELCDFANAMDWNQRGLEMALAINAPVPEVEMNARLNLGENLLAQGRLDEAEQHFRAVETVVREPKSAWMLWRYAQRFFHGFGEWWLARGDPARALAHADECLAWAERSGSRKNVVKSRRLRSQAYLAQGRLREAEEEIAVALQLAEEVGSPPQIWKTHAALGDVRLAEGRPEDARRAYRDALAVIDGVAAGLTDESLRATFLASDHVRGIRDAAQTPGARSMPPGHDGGGDTMSGRILWHKGRPPNRAELLVEQVASTKPMALFFTSVGSRLDRTLLEASKGRLGLVMTLPVLLLHTTGANTGQEHTTPLLYVQDSGRIFLVAGNGGRPHHPAWYHNLRANPGAVVEIKGRHQPVVAREAEGAEREEGWRKATEMYRGYEVYQGRMPGRRFPVMVLEPAG